MALRIVGQPGSDRGERVAELSRLGFGWADLGDEQYWIDQLVVVDRRTYEEIFAASARLWGVFDKAARYVLGNRRMYELLSVPEVLWDGLDMLEPGPAGLMSRYARFDFAVLPADVEGDRPVVKLLELNADTPTGYAEAAIATPWLCGQYGIWTPNAAMAGQVRAAWGAERPGHAACVAYGEHAEDTGTIDALVKHSGLDVACVDCLDLWVDEGIVRGAEGERIERMFALYPKEWMAVDDGGEALAYAIENGFVQLFNPLHAIVLQSKGLQAVIWGLHELGSDLFDDGEHECIARYMLPTYDSPVFEGDYVSKSMFGREGGSVKIYGPSGQLDAADEEGFDTTVFFAPVYQERAQLPQIELHNGRFHLLTGVFVIDGRPCGMLGRAGGLITGNSSHFIAMGVEEG